MNAKLLHTTAVTPNSAHRAFQPFTATCSIHMQHCRAKHRLHVQPFASLPQPQPQRVDIQTCSTADSAQARGAITQRPTAFSRFGITGDGSCMFRACVQGHYHLQHGKQMPSSEEYSKALELRQAVVEELRKNREDMEPFLPGIADDFDDYLRKMSQPGVWGGEPELLMASRVLSRPISVYQPTWLGPPQHIITYGEEFAKSAETMHLLWSGAHYDLLLPQPASKL